MPGKKLKFPIPSSVKPDNPAVLCTADRVLGLYNENSGDSAQRIAKKVRTWFAAEAARRGWAGVHFLPEIQSSHGAGCVLWLPPQRINISVQITNQVLVLNAQSE
ncbi:MAG TPA: hypothetical protein VK629_12465 [Steroidobacteraceae bacterium]|nr:hypothetical protein [Steroidobacteraceae bacterium]